jgi:uncharacterized protein YuzE
MKITYSAAHSLLYVRLRAGETANTVEIAPDVYVDVDEAGSPLGVEFLNAADFLPFLARHDGRLDAEMLQPLTAARHPRASAHAD